MLQKFCIARETQCPNTIIYSSKQSFSNFCKLFDFYKILVAKGFPYNMFLTASCTVFILSLLKVYSMLKMIRKTIYKFK